MGIKLAYSNPRFWKAFVAAAAENDVSEISNPLIQPGESFLAWIVQL